MSLSVDLRNTRTLLRDDEGVAGGTSAIRPHSSASGTRSGLRITHIEAGVIDYLEFIIYCYRYHLGVSMEISDLHCNPCMHGHWLLVKA